MFQNQTKKALRSPYTKGYLDELICNDNEIIEANSVSNEFQYEVGSIINDENFLPSTSLQQWLGDLNTSSSEESLENDNEAENNQFKNEKFAKFLLRLSESLVLWSGVAASHFGAPARASSAHVECYFKNIKKDLQSVIPGRVDEVVAAHIELIDGMIFDASQNYIEFVDAAGGVKNLIADHTELIKDYDDNASTTHGSKSADCNILQRNDEVEQENDIDDIDTESQPVNQGNYINSTQLDDTVSSSMTSCEACKRGDEPGGAHRCFKCKKAVHMLSGCSNSIGDEEGFGEKRICIACAAEPKSQKNESSCKKSFSQSIRKSNVDSICKQLNEKEAWQRKAKSNRSYLAPVKNWNIDKKVQGKPKILLLSNASLSTTIHTINKKKVALRNTCAPDSLFQVMLNSSGILNILLLLLLNCF